MFTIRNAALVAIMQVGVIVAGVLGAGLCHKAWSSSGMPMPLPVELLVNYGVFGFSIPLGWAACALSLRSRPEISDDVKNLVFWLGVLLLIALVISVLYADVTPWFRVMWRMGGDNDG